MPFKFNDLNSSFALAQHTHLPLPPPPSPSPSPPLAGYFISPPPNVPQTIYHFIYQNPVWSTGLIAFALTTSISILASSSTSTSPTTHTLSPRIKYTPSSTTSTPRSAEYIRSLESVRIRFWRWSKPDSVPCMMRPSRVRIFTCFFR